MSTKCHVESVLRIRPVQGKEEPCMICKETKGFTLQADDMYFGDETFSAVLGPKTSQHDVFLTIGQPIVDAVMRGENACLFAYGQTGAGKTFSMYGENGGTNSSRLDGAVPSICAEIFRRKQDFERRNANMQVSARPGVSRGSSTPPPLVPLCASVPDSPCNPCRACS